MLNAYKITDKKLAAAEAEEGEIFFYADPTDAEKEHLISAWHIDPFTLNSSLDPDEIPRLEFEENYTAFIVKKPRPYAAEDRFRFFVTSFGIFLFEDRVVIVVNGDDINLNKEKKFAKIASLREFVIKLLYISVAHFNEHLKVINMISNELESQINTSMENRYLLDMFSLSKGLVYYLEAINANGNLFQKMINSSRKIKFDEDEKELLENLGIENSQCFKTTEIYSNILSSMMDARVSIVSNNLNMLMKNLNIMTIGIMVPTFVVSAFSMNVGIPFHNHPHAFAIVLGVSALSVLVFLGIWRFRGQ